MNLKHSLTAPECLLGAVCSVMLKSPSHRKLLLESLEWLILPPIELRQIEIFGTISNPIGYAVWALLSDEAVARLLATTTLNIHVDEWRSGDNCWVVDFICPFAQVNDAKEYLKTHRLQDTSITLLAPRVSEGRFLGFEGKPF